MINLIVAPFALAAFILGIAAGAIVAFVRAPPSATTGTRVVFCPSDAEVKRLQEEYGRTHPPSAPSALSPP